MLNNYERIFFIKLKSLYLLEFLIVLMVDVIIVVFIMIKLNL